MQTLYGNKLEAETVDISELSPYAIGYIFTPTGEVIEVPETDDHSSVFSDYYSKYLELKEPVMMDIFKASQRLCKLNHSVYLGGRLKDTNGKTTTNVGINNIIVPNDINNIPEKEKEVLTEFLDNRSYKSLVISIVTFDKQFYTEEDFLKKIKTSYQKSNNPQ